MGFWTPNIERRGRVMRGIIAVILSAAAFLVHRSGIAWVAWPLALAGIFTLCEALRGWCVLRACKIKTRL